jgi:hypothetical protein
MIDETGFNDKESELHERFNSMLTPTNRHFYRALIQHLAPISQDSCVEMYLTLR